MIRGIVTSESFSTICLKEMGIIPNGDPVNGQEGILTHTQDIDPLLD